MGTVAEIHEWHWEEQELVSEDYKNGFRQAVLCVGRFWDNIDLYYDNPSVLMLDDLTKTELKNAMNKWAESYLDKVIQNEN